MSADPSEPEAETILYVDTRERDVAAIADLLDQVAAEKEELNRSAGRAGYRYEKRQLTTGDFAIVRRVPGPPAREYILCTVERKTLVDYAASLRDGRYENIHKQLELHRRYGTRVVLLVEGPANPAPTTKFSRIPFRNIESSFTQLMVEHPVQILFTPDAARSASRMLDLQRAFHKLEGLGGVAPVGADEPGGSSGGGETGASGSGAGRGAETAAGVLTAAQARSPTEDLLTMWSRLPNISRTLGGIVARAFSAEELLAGSAEDRARRVLGLRTAFNKQLPAGARRTLIALGTDTQLQLRLLGGVAGVSKTVAAQLLDETKGRGSIQALLAQNPEPEEGAPGGRAPGEDVPKKRAPKKRAPESRYALEMVPVPHGAGMRPLGAAKAAKVIEALRRKIGPATQGGE